MRSYSDFIDITQLTDVLKLHVPRHYTMQATQLGRVLCTYDTDFLSLVGQFPNHAGVVFAYRQKATIGGWVRGIRTLHGRLTAEEIVGQVICLPTR